MIINKTRNTIISQNEIMCNNLFSQMRGLMFRKKQNLIMIFPKERKVKLHMFFVFYPIDVIVVDENLKITEIKTNFKPFTFWNSPIKGKYVVELAYPSAYKIRDSIQLSLQKS